MLRKFLLIGLALWAPIGAWALGLGDIKLNSRLNEPMSAEIEIAVSEPNELLKFSANIASAETFARYGLDRPAFLNSFRFQLRKVSSNKAVLQVISSQAITEPFVTFLVEANWERGRLLREYTVLLDPPVFNDQAVAAPVSVAQSVAAQPTYSSGQILQPATPAPAPAPTPAPVYRPAVIAGDTYGPVRRNENLWNISKSALADGVTINQMMVAIYRANPDAFMGNINLLKEGATLQIPNSDVVRDLNRATANNVVVDHNASWRGRVNTRVASSTRSSSAGTSQSSNRLELIAPENDQAGVGGGASAEELEQARDLLAQEEAENERLGDEIANVRAELEETKRLLNLRNSSLAELQQSLSQTTPADPATAVDTGTEVAVETDLPVTATTDTAVDTTDPEAAPVAATTPDPVTSITPDPVVEAPVTVVTQPVAEEPGIISKFFGWLSNWWLYAAAMGVGLLSILGVVFYMLRGREKSESASWDSSIKADETDLDLDASLDKVAAQSEATGVDDTSEVEYFEDTGTFKPIDFNANDSAEAASGEDSADYPFEDTLAGETGVKLDQQDALSEADFHLAYGLYDQAAQLVSSAAEKEPARLDLQTKLLEIYFVWGNKDDFRTQAENIKGMLGDTNPGEWEKIMIMGKQICPDDGLFAGDASAPIMADSVDLALDEPGYAELDFPTGSEDGADAQADNNVVDLDLGDALFVSDDAPTSSGTEDMDLSGEGGLDFDFDLDVSPAAVDDAPTASEPAVKEKIEQALSATSGEDTEEMDLDALGIDLDFGDITSVSEGTSGEFAIADAVEDTPETPSVTEEDFDELFAGLDDLEEVPDATDDIAAATEQTTETSTADFASGDKLLDTSELKVEMEELLAAEIPGLNDIDETSQGIEQLEGDTGSFSAEIRALSEDGLDIGEELAATNVKTDDFGIGDDDETVLQEALVIDPETPDLMSGTDLDDVFAGADDETQLSEALIDADDPVDLDLDQADAFSSDTTSMPGISASADADLTSTSEAVTFHGVFDAPPTENVPPPDEFSENVFGGGSEGHTQEMRNIDLDVGETVDESSDGTTVRVATSNLALPENVDLAINEVGTKLDLARAYLDMGDPDGARGILEEVMQEGNETQQIDARQMLESLS